MSDQPVPTDALGHLHSALMAAFGTPAGARLLLRQAGIPVDLLRFDQPPAAIWADALALATARGQLEDLRASGAAHHPEAGAFTLPLGALGALGASATPPIPPAPANVVRKLTRVLAGSLSARDRAALLSALGVDPAHATDPEAAVEALALAGCLRDAWDRIRAERPRALTLPYPDDLPAAGAATSGSGSDLPHPDGA